MSSNGAHSQNHDHLQDYTFVDVSKETSTNKLVDTGTEDSIQSCSMSDSSASSHENLPEKSHSKESQAMSQSCSRQDNAQAMSTAEFQQTVLLEFKKMHERMDKLRNEVLTEMKQLDKRISRLENNGKWQNSSMPSKPSCLPIKDDCDVQMFEKLSEDEYDNVVQYFEFVTGSNVKETVNNIIKEAIQDQYCMDLTWHGKNDKKSFINTRLSRAIFEAVSRSKLFERPNGKEFQCAVTEALRNSKQRVRNRTAHDRNAAQENRKRPYIKIKEEFTGL